MDPEETGQAPELRALKSGAVDRVDSDLGRMEAVKRLKGVEDRRVGSEVFDELTLKTLYKLANSGYLAVLNGAVSTGKEANVFKGITDNDEFVAVKIYRVATSDFKKMQYYIQGDPRFRVRTTNRRQLVQAWVNKEFRNLKRALEAGVRVPEPVVARDNILIMEFIGDDGEPAPTMREVPPDDPERALELIVEYMHRLYTGARLVHGDLSFFNILNHSGEPVIIDVSQAMVLDHPLAMELLERDIKNVVRDFKRLGVNVSEDDIRKKIKKEAEPPAKTNTHEKN
ncbi:serine protein kinase RIO [Methanothermobacter marburgensis]|uniref:non-specific serine/threonine protein kinase n=1 Tax=Methanothermobacter marburgensis (strain ATCC BAA-927 / DSM 2133 / JCM 14651 / NBRC 100331 / OCM 82 / Marburg) TaxID=79929 RepID=D9PXM6_METTM|nr:serine protein kinase RIO [Methanothermobacter marburgensis]ADL58974.1 predicted serine/threonine protein kinase [Methanothermobacter marburgensis str. Marburg]WBF09511.1 serine protein kinase RIO [Methanothermobacter marburgensis]